MEFSRCLTKAISASFVIARFKGSEFLECSHLIAAFTDDEDCVAGKLLIDYGIPRVKIPIGIKPEKIPFSPALEAAFEMSGDIARSFGSNEIGSEHILYSILSCENSFTAISFRNAKINVNAILDELFAVMTYSTNNEDDEYDECGNDENDDTPKQNNKQGGELKKYGRNLTELASKGKIGPVFGRDEEIERVITVLMRRQKSCPCLIGDAGVGKSAIVEGLACKIASGKVPDKLKNTQIISFEMSSVVAGTKYRGDFEERLHLILEEAIRKKAIIFIDEIHTIIGTGASEGGNDAANILKPYLAREAIRLIGATTYSEYRRKIERDPALKRRFSAVEIKEPDEETTLMIIEGVIPHYEAHHSIKIRHEAALAAIEYSKKYLGELYFPDKAIDLIDEAAAKNKVNGRATLTALDIKKLISARTGIPLKDIGAASDKKITKLEKLLNRRLIGQDEAVNKVIMTIRAAFADIGNDNKPRASFIFAGPTGVGKTELAKLMAKALFDKEDAFLRFDMSEYMEKSSASKLIGAPPGYIGYGEGGTLTEAVSRRPYSLVLFDEAEKASNEIFDLFLQILDEGTLSDSLGRKIDFSNCFIVFTTNTGAELARAEPTKAGFIKDDDKDKRNDTFSNALKGAFRPEFLNRIDEIIVFREFEKKDVSKIANMFLRDLRTELNEKGIIFKYAPNVAMRIAEECNFSEYGAREVKRAIRRAIEEPLAKIISSSDFDRIVIKAIVLGGEIVLKVAEEILFDQKG